MNSISVVLPVYNNTQILNSLKHKIIFLSHNYNQVIIIDDCSQDTTYYDLVNFVKDSNIKNIEILKNSKNMGPSYSRNKGIKKSVGEYIAFLDSDDDWHPQKIEIQIQMMQKYDVHLCGTIHKVINENELENAKSCNYLGLKNIQFKEIKWPKILFVSPFATPSVVMHKSLKNYLFNENIRYSEDYNLWKRITYKHRAIKILLPLTYTFKHDYISKGNSLSINLKKMQSGIENSFQYLLKSNQISFYNKGLVLFALLFSKIKYLRRVIKSRIN